ncbi:MAG: hypothetical protein ABW005_02935, partial [Burkholderiaceae bacterium]
MKRDDTVADFSRFAGSARDRFFSHHGPWALGVRLFRRLRFGAKAGLISLAFLLPLGLLALAYLRASQETIAFARHELAGVEALVRLEPWLLEVQNQRRQVLAGLSARPDMAAIDERIRPLRELLASRPDGLDLHAELAKVDAMHQALSALLTQGGATAKPEEMAAALQAYINGLSELRTTALDRSNLTLDPDQDTYYLMTLATDSVSQVIEAISRTRALAGAAGRSGRVEAASLRQLFGVWYAGNERVAGISQAAARAAEANPEVGRRLKPQEAVGVTQRYFAAAAAAWFSADFDAHVQALDAPGDQAVDGLRELAQQSTV